MSSSVNGAAGPADVDRRAGFETVFLDPFGQAVQQRWTVAASAGAFEDLDPVSAFPVPPGRRWGPGLWRRARSDVDRDPRVVGLAGRPVRLLWRNYRGQVRSWVPQLFARYADGTGGWSTTPPPAHPASRGARTSGWWPR